MAQGDWTQTYGSGGIDSTTEMPDLTDETTPGANDGDPARSSTVEALRDSLIEAETQIGDPTAPATGSLLGRSPTTTEKEALAGTSGSPSTSNKYVTEADPLFADAVHDNVAGEITAVTEKASPVGADVLLIEDSEDSNNKKRVQITNLPGGSGTDADAIHDNVAAEISAITEKASPVSADLVVIEDSEDSNNKKRVQVGNLPGGGGGGTASNGQLEIYDDDPPASNINVDSTATPVQIAPETGSFSVTIDSAGLYRVDVTAAPLYDYSGASDNFKFKVVFDEGLGSEVVVGNDDRWTFRLASNQTFDYIPVAWHGKATLAAKTYTAKVYCEREGSTSSKIVFATAGNAVQLSVQSVQATVSYAIQDSITANAGGGQGSAVEIAWGTAARVSTCATTGDSVKLAASAPTGLRTLVRNDGANSCDVFPPSGGQINGLGVNTAYALAAGSSVTFTAFTATQAYTY